MRNLFLALILVVPASCGLTGKNTDEPPQATLPAWNGEHILCGAQVNYDKNNRDPFPVFQEDDRLGFCARTIRYLELNRQYGDQTPIFGIAAAVTTSFAASYAPFVRRVYSQDTWAFMATLSAELEPQFTGFADAFANGTPRPLPEMIDMDQDLAQARLDALRDTDPDAYTTLIAELNDSLNPTNPMLLAAINRNPFFAAYEAGLAQIRAKVGGRIDYSQRSQRVMISQMLQRLFQGIPDGAT